MAINLNDNLKINAGKPVDSKYLNLSNQPYANIVEVNSVVSISERYIGLTVNIANIEYWYRNGVTNSDLVLKTADGGSGENISKEINQTSHGFVVGDVLAYSGNTYVKAIADGTLDGEVFGLVTQVLGANDFVITFAGYVDTLSGATLQANTLYYLSDQNLGELSTDEPIELGHISKPILYTTTVSEGFVLNQRGVLLATGSTSGGSTSGITQVLNVGNGQDLFKSIIPTASGLTAQFRRIQNGVGTSIVTSGDSIVVNVTGSTAFLGAARDGDYTDGLFPFEETTPVGFAIDDINEFLQLILPASPSVLDDHFASGSFVDGKLSFGTSRNDISYTNVSTAAGFSAVDINGSFLQSGDRRGITASPISGVLNEDVVDGQPDGIPYENESFSDANVGILIMELNGNIIDTLDLESSVNDISSLYMDVSELKFTKFINGNEFTQSSYRTGTYDLPVIEYFTGYNYLRIIHSATTFNRVTNYVDWVYDNNSQNISVSSPQITNITTTGSRFISGVEYDTGGNFDYTATASNVYRNIYSNSSSAIDFINKEKVGSLLSIGVTGSGINAGSSQALPNLRTDVSNPQAQDINIVANLRILTGTTVIGNTTAMGRVGTEINIQHAFSGKTFSGGQATASGFLIYPFSQTLDYKNEDLIGEELRLQAREYSALSYNNIDLGAYEWDSTQNIVTSPSTQYNNGMLVLNGELVYPNSSYITTQYGITNGNFSLMSNGPSGNVNYSSASGIRNYYRLFQSSNIDSLSELFIEIEHTGSANDFLTNASTSGTPSGNQIKVELLIKRGSVGDFETYGWFNPFSTNSASQEGISIIGSPIQNGNTTSLACIFPPNIRIGENDFVIMRMFFSASYSNRISNIELTNL